MRLMPESLRFRWHRLPLERNYQLATICKGKRMTDISAADDLNAQNEKFFAKTDAAFRALFDKARSTNELQFAFSLVPEFRGTQSAGWNTAVEAHRAFDEYLAFLNAGELTPLKARITLAFYCHVAEASGFYEIPKNMLRVADGGFYNLWPFQDLAEVHNRTGNVIAPNANKVIRDLAGHAASINFHDLAEVFRDAVDADIRNGYAHADYIVWDDGIRLRRRNGGNTRLVTWPEFHHRFERGINFFNILRQLVKEEVRSYSPPKEIMGRYSDARTAKVTIGFDPTTGSFSITDSSP